MAEKESQQRKAARAVEKAWEQAPDHRTSGQRGNLTTSHLRAIVTAAHNLAEIEYKNRGRQSIPEILQTAVTGDGVAALDAQMAWFKDRKTQFEGIIVHDNSRDRWSGPVYSGAQIARVSEARQRLIICTRGLDLLQAQRKQDYPGVPETTFTDTPQVAEPPKPTFTRSVAYDWTRGWR